ncbi:MAG: hypothetical protein M1812_008237 [Candelaria pacifica]|nr:MAG: hypothetical protein M1812_008237 [Candelaria pacifica]
MAPSSAQIKRRKEEKKRQNADSGHITKSSKKLAEKAALEMAKKRLRSKLASIEREHEEMRASVAEGEMSQEDLDKEIASKSDVINEVNLKIKKIEDKEKMDEDSDIEGEQGFLHPDTGDALHPLTAAVAGKLAPGSSSSTGDAVQVSSALPTERVTPSDPQQHLNAGNTLSHEPASVTGSLASGSALSTGDAEQVSRTPPTVKVTTSDPPQHLNAGNTLSHGPASVTGNLASGSAFNIDNPKDVSMTSSSVPGSSISTAIQIEEDPDDLLTQAQWRQKCGADSGGTIVAYNDIPSSNRKLFIMQYGPSNLAKYRLQSSTDVDFSEDPDTHDFGSPKNNLGQLRDPETRLYVRKRQEIHAVQGVAWVYDEMKHEDPLKLMEPKKNKNDKRRFPNTRVKVSWWFDNKKHYSWETRTSFRRLWGKKPEVGDRAIYLAAQAQMVRHERFAAGERSAMNISPSPNPEINRLIKEESADLDPNAARPSIEVPQTSNNQKGVATASEVEETSKYEKAALSFRMMWAMDHGRAPNARLTEDEQYEFAEKLQKYLERKGLM